MRVGIFSIFSELHDRQKIAEAQQNLRSVLAPDLAVEFIENLDFSRFDFILVCVLTGGCEGKFTEIWPELKAADKSMAMLAFTTANSLPAALEIRTWLIQRKQAQRLPLVHGEIEEIADKIVQLANQAKIAAELKRTRIGVIGEPSAWLIASNADYAAFSQRFGLSFADIPMREFKLLLESTPLPDGTDFTGKFASGKEELKGEICKAEKIYCALKRLIKNYGLNALTLRCFDLLDAENTTGCLALAALNDEGIVAGCEADVPAAISMIIGEKFANQPVFMANPARVSGDEAIFAHCTVPCSILSDFSLKSHFESGIGLAVAGNFMAGPFTLLKISSDASSFALGEGKIVESLQAGNLCRTQIRVKIPGISEYLLKTPLGNHQIIIPGQHAAKLQSFLESAGLKNIWNQPALP